MDFNTYVKNVIDIYINKEGSNVVFIKHYNTLKISEETIISDAENNDDRIFLYHEYEAHVMHSAFAPFLQWICECYEKYYKERMSVEYFLKQCNVYSLHIEPLAGYIRNKECTRRETALHFEVSYEGIRMRQDILNIMDRISQDHDVVIVLSKFHLAPYSTIQLFNSLIKSSFSINAVVLYNDEFIVAPYKKDVWEELLTEAENQDIQLEWCSLDSEKTIDVQDSFWFDKNLKDEYFEKLRNMYHTFSLNDAYYYINDIINRLDEKTIRLSKEDQISLLELYAFVEMDLGFEEYALVTCDRLADLGCPISSNINTRYNYYYICARAQVMLPHMKKCKEYCQKCISIAEEMGDDYLKYKAEIFLWAAECGIGKTIFEYNFPTDTDMGFIEKTKANGFTNFLAYLYAFGFENDPDSVSDIAMGKKEPYYFNMGIKLGTEIGNDNLLLNAYMKNINLYTKYGYYNYVKEMYTRRLAVLKVPNPLRESHMLAGLGYNSLITENFEQAHSYLMKSVINLTKLEKPQDVMDSLYNMALNYFFAENYAAAISVVELIIKMMKEMIFQPLKTCSMTKLYGLIAISCYYRKEYYNTYYYMSKMEVIVDYMLRVLRESGEELWDEDFMIYHLVKGMLNSYENKFELAQSDFDEVRELIVKVSGSSFFAVSIYAVEQATLYFKQGKNEKAKEIIDDAVSYCEKRGYQRKKSRLMYFKEHGTICTEPIMSTSDTLPVEKIIQISKQKGILLKLERREKDIKFLTVLQETISRENLNANDLYINMSAVIKSSYSLDDIVILRRKDGELQIMPEEQKLKLSDENIDEIFDFIKDYRQAFLTNRVEKNFIQFKPIMKYFDEKHIMMLIGIPIMEQSGTENIFIGTIMIKRGTVSGAAILGNGELMILKFAFSQFCEMMRKIDSRLIIERMNKQLERSAVTDHLTGITNRSGFSKQAELLYAQSSSITNILIYIDLDNFKYYNDTFGHEVGDLVLVNFSDIIKRMTVGKGLAVRYGGDEFIVLLYNETEEGGVQFAKQIYREIKDGFVENISKKLDMEINIPDNRKISCSIGIASFRGGSKDELETALIHADQMLYEVKRHGKSHYKLYITNTQPN